MYVILLTTALLLLIVSMVASIIQRRKHAKLGLVSHRLFRVELVLTLLAIAFLIFIGCVLVPYAIQHPNYLYEQLKN